MGLGDLARKAKEKNVQESDSSDADNRSSDVAPEQAKTRKYIATDDEKPKRVVILESVGEDVQDFLASFYDINKQIKMLETVKENLKKKAIELAKKYGADDFEGAFGKVQVIHSKPAMTFDKKRARMFLTEDQYDKCFKRGAQKAPMVKFTPAKDAPPVPKKELMLPPDCMDF